MLISFFFFNKVVDLLIGNFYSHSTTGHCTLRGEEVGGRTMPYEISLSLQKLKETLQSIVALL